MKSTAKAFHHRFPAYLCSTPHIQIAVIGPCCFKDAEFQLGDAKPKYESSARSAILNASTGIVMYQHQHVKWLQGVPYLGFLSELFGRRREHATLPSQRLDAPLTNPTRSDAQIVQDVKDELGLEPSVCASGIDVRVKDGVVMLTGSVGDNSERRLIEAAAQRIAGIKSLSIKLKTIVPEPGVSTDDDIARECEDVLANMLPRSDYTIQVMVSNGWVTLSGDVALGGERWNAETAVSALTSVRGVNCQINVRPAVVKDDVDANIEAAMLGPKGGKPHTIESIIDHDRVTLTGTVHSWNDRRAALNAAGSSAGVRRVFDQMKLV
jgi:osmotically-inducible protein OsmY